MRIITGKRKGLKLDAPKGLDTRPTESRIKESLFNILGNVSNSNVLDLFAGSGSIGLEFLSRDANYVAFIDNDKNAINCIKKNVKKAKLPGTEIIFANYKKGISKLENKNIKFDYVYIDPPYNSVSDYNKVLKIVSQSSLFENSLIIIEMDEKLDLENLDSFEIIDKRKYRKTILLFLRRNNL